MDFAITPTLHTTTLPNGIIVESPATTGTIMYNGEHFLVYTGTDWKTTSNGIIIETY